MLFEQLEEFVNKSNANKIVIRAEVEPLVSEDGALSQKSSDLFDAIDDRTFDEWTNFENGILYYIEKNHILHSISTKRAPNTISEYIDFQTSDGNGGMKESIINLRLICPSDEISENYRLVGVTVDGKAFDGYDEALALVKEEIEHPAASVLFVDIMKGFAETGERENIPGLTECANKLMGSENGEE